jgi:hypothetical protein
MGGYGGGMGGYGGYGMGGYGGYGGGYGGYGMGYGGVSVRSLGVPSPKTSSRFHYLLLMLIFFARFISAFLSTEEEA